MSNFKQLVINEYRKQIKISLSEGNKAKAELFKKRIEVLNK